MHPEGFPSDRNQVNCVFAVRSEHFAYFLCVRPIRQRLHAPKCTGKGRALERSHQLEHRIPSAPLTVISDLRRSENDAGGHRDRVDEVCKSRDVHFSEDRSHARGKGRRRWGRAGSHKRMADRLSLRSVLVSIQPSLSLSSSPLAVAAAASVPFSSTAMKVL